MHRLFQIVGQKAPDPIDHPAHSRSSAPILGAQDAILRGQRSASRLLSPNLVRTHCNLVHSKTGSSRAVELRIVSHKICRTMRVQAHCQSPAKRLDTMSRLSRRSFLAASAAMVAAPALRARAGRGATWTWRSSAPARLASRRRGAIAAANDASSCSRRATGSAGAASPDTAIFGVAVRSRRALDSSARRQSADRIRRQAHGLDIYAAPRGQAVRIGPRNARDCEMEAFLTCLGARASCASSRPVGAERTSRLRGSARRSWRLASDHRNSCSGPLPAARILHQFPQWILHVCRSATTMLFAGRAMAR